MRTPSINLKSFLGLELGFEFEFEFDMTPISNRVVTNCKLSRYMINHISGYDDKVKNPNDNFTT